MCHICTERGEGTIWYLNPKNYARNMYKLRPPGEKPVQEVPPVEGEGGPLVEAIEAKCNGDMAKYNEIIKRFNESFLRGEQCSVLPLADCLKVVDLSSPIAAMHCICRKRLRAREETTFWDYSCTGIGSGMLKWERWPERYKGGVKFMTSDEAREWLTYWDKQGMVHMIMNYGGQIGGICNCDYPDCVIIRYRLDYGLDNALIKGHYVASVDYDKCNGCGVCVQRCQFGALKFEITIDKVNIDQYRCFGCGVCETGCPRGAITLLDRASLPGLREAW